MQRIANIAGMLLTVAGLALLTYVGVTWWQERQAQTARSSVEAVAWSGAQHAQGRQIAARLSKRPSHLPPIRRLPAPGSEPALRLVIPAIGVDAPVVESTPQDGVWPVPDWVVGHLTTTPNPGGVGNLALSAHDDIKGEIFKRLGEVKPGTPIYLRTRHVLYTYVVIGQRTVDPTDITVLEPTTSPTVTLVSCTPYWVDTQRLAVQALLKSRRAVA